MFEAGGHISKESFEGHREFFLGKSVQRLKHEMNKQGYDVKIEPSKHPNSKARKLTVLNPSKEMLLLSMYRLDKKHGETAYVRVCTNDVGKFKVAVNIDKYKTDGKEKAVVYAARRKKK